jgi:hypothetical protein
MKLPKKYPSNISLLALGSPLGVLIALKTVIEVKLHLWEHKKAKR